MTDSRKRQTSDPLAFPEGGSDARLKTLAARPEVAALRQALRQLPDVEPDPAGWAKIQNRARPEKAESQECALSRRFVQFVIAAPRFAIAAPRFAIAAGLLLAVSAGILGLNVLRDGDLIPTLPPNQVVSLPVESDAIRLLRERSRVLEPITQRYNADPVASAFRYRIADVDAQLSSIPEGRLNQAEAQRLWGQRVALLESLAEVRRARAALQPAVY